MHWQYMRGHTDGDIIRDGSEIKAACGYAGAKRRDRSQTNELQDRRATRKDIPCNEVTPMIYPPCKCGAAVNATEYFKHDGLCRDCYYAKKMREARIPYGLDED